MIKCSNCQREIADPRKKCPHCNADPMGMFTCQNCFTTQKLQQFCPFCQTPLSGPQTGKEIHYQNWIFFIRERLGTGGMGEVYRSIEFNTDTKTLREIAVKFNRDLESPQKIQRFRLEAQTIMQLQNPHLTTIYNYIEIKKSDLITTQFITMELLRGKNLQQIISEGPLPLPEAIEIYRQIATALSQAHEKGIIHRDLKPSNIILINKPEDPPFTKLIDFGLSKNIFISSPLSSSGIVLGTLWYMSPEQARGEDIDPRSDIFSLGVILYQMITGTLPFPAENLYQLYQMHPKGPKSLPENIPPNLTTLLEKSLKFHPKERPQTLRQCLKILLNSEITTKKRKKIHLPPKKLLYTLISIMISATALALFFIPKTQNSQNEKNTKLHQKNTPIQKNSSKITTPNPKTKKQTSPTKNTKLPQKKIPISIKTEPKCRLFLIKNKNTKPIPPKIYLPPGKYTFLCFSSKNKLKRSFQIKVPSHSSQKITVFKKWKKITVKILLLPWGYTYIDGFYYPQCQYGCEIKLWEGTSIITLKRPIQGTKKQITVYRKKIFISKKLLKLPPTKRIIKIRWQKKISSPPQ